MKLIKILIITSVIAVFVTACKEERYLIVIFNQSEQEINQLRLWLDGQSYDYGTIKKDSKQTGIFEQQRLTSTIKLTWQDSNGLDHEQTFMTFDYIPDSYSQGRIHLKYNNQSFDLSFDNSSF